MKYFETLLLRIFDSKIYNIYKFKSLVRYSRIQSLAIKLIIETDSWFIWIRVIIIPYNFWSWLTSNWKKLETFNGIHLIGVVWIYKLIPSVFVQRYLRLVSYIILWSINIRLICAKICYNLVRIIEELSEKYLGFTYLYVISFRIYFISSDVWSFEIKGYSFIHQRLENFEAWSFLPYILIGLFHLSQLHLTYWETAHH